MDPPSKKISREKIYLHCVMVECKEAQIPDLLFLKIANSISYDDLKPQTILEHKLIINTTPLGMFPEIQDAPGIPYSFISSQHLLFDLIYNPEETEFLKRGKQQGAQTKNGKIKLI